MHQTTSPRVSIITPYYNASATLNRSITSVLAQDFADWEMILSDDGSTDNSAELAAHWADLEPRIKPVGQSMNQGAAQARNRAMALATGRYIAFLDADDEWLPGKLTRRIAFMAAQEAPFSYTGFYRQKAGQTARRKEVRVPASVSYDDLLHGNVIGCLTAIFDREAFGAVEMPDIRRRQDYGLWLRLLRQTDRAYGLQEPLAVYHKRKGSLSSNKWGALKGNWTIYRSYEGLSRRASVRALAHHLWWRVRS